MGCLAVVLGFRNMARRGHSWQLLRFQQSECLGAVTEGPSLKSPPPPLLGRRALGLTPVSSGQGQAFRATWIRCLYHFTVCILPLRTPHCNFSCILFLCILGYAVLSSFSLALSSYIPLQRWREALSGLALGSAPCPWSL